MVPKLLLLLLLLLLLKEVFSLALDRQTDDAE